MVGITQEKNVANNQKKTKKLKQQLNKGILGENVWGENGRKQTLNQTNESMQIYFICTFQNPEKVVSVTAINMNCG